MPPKNNLLTPIQYLKGIGPRRAEALAELGITTVRDLLFYFPYGYIDLSNVGSISGLKAAVASRCLGGRPRRSIPRTVPIKVTHPPLATADFSRPVPP